MVDQLYFVGRSKEILKRDALTSLERLLVSSMLLVEEETLRKVQQPRSSKMRNTLSYIPRGIPMQ